MKMKLIMLGLVAAFACGCDKDDDENEINGTDREFTLRASMANYAEIDAGMLASTKAMDDGIRDFGVHMVAEHTLAGQELKSIAGSLRLNTPDSLDAEHQQLKMQLMSLTGRAFDSVYIHAQVKDHQKTIKLFEDESNGGSHRQLTDYANEKLPHLRLHLHKADSLAAEY